MSPSPVRCPQCQAVMPAGVFNQPAFQPCPACGAELQIDIFPSLFRETAPGQAGETVMTEGESTCFYHSTKRAVRACDGCGRFVCGLCDCELHGQHYCPACLETGRTKGKIKSLENRRTLYDSIALSLAVYPMLIFYFTIITAPMALFMAIRYWNAPRSIVHRTKIRYVVAIILATLQILGWGLGIYLVTNAMTRHG